MWVLFDDALHTRVVVRVHTLVAVLDDDVVCGVGGYPAATVFTQLEWIGHGGTSRRSLVSTHGACRGSRTHTGALSSHTLRMA